MGQLFNLVQFTTATTGTGTITVGSATANCRTPLAAGIPDLSYVSYTIRQGTAGWEFGRGLIGGTSTTMQRKVAGSSAGGTTPLTLAGGEIVTITSLADDIVPRAGYRLATLGDSLTALNNENPGGGTAFNYPQNGYLNWFNAMTGGAFAYDDSLNFARGGETSSGQLHRLDPANVTNGRSIIGNINNFDIMVVCVGVNDILITNIYSDTSTTNMTNQNVTSITTEMTTTVSKEITVANLKAISSRISSYGKAVVLFGIPPRDDSGAGTVAQLEGYRRRYLWVNQQMQAWCRTQPGIEYIDIWRDVADPNSDTGAYIPSMSLNADKLHFGTKACPLIAERVVHALQGDIPPTNNILFHHADVYNADNPSGNIVLNAQMTGSIGNPLPAGIAMLPGQPVNQPIYWNWARYLATNGYSDAVSAANTFLSFETPAFGRSGEPFAGRRMVMAWTPPTSAASNKREILWLNHGTLAPAGLTFDLNSRWQCGCEIEFSNIGPNANIVRVSFEFRFLGGGVLKEYRYMNLSTNGWTNGTGESINPQVAGRRLVYRMQNMICPANTTGCDINIFLEADLTTLPGQITMKMNSPFVRKMV